MKIVIQDDENLHEETLPIFSFFFKTSFIFSVIFEMEKHSEEHIR